MIKYKCSGCGKDKAKDDLVVKRVQFREMGMNGKVTSTRTVAWLCPPCLAKDPDTGRDAYMDAPGTSAKRGADGSR
jgi:hypothetical protein